MVEIDVPEQLVAAQRAVDAAWDAVAEYRRKVTARRRANGQPEPGRPWAGLAPWTPESAYTGPGVLCRDGAISFSSGRGTCSHHGGEA